MQRKKSMFLIAHDFLIITYRYHVACLPVAFIYLFIFFLIFFFLLHNALKTGRCEW